MALVDTTWYCNAGDQATTGYYAVVKRPQNAAVAAGQLCRQFTAPAVGSERVFICIIAGTTANVTDATWVLTRGAKTTDGTATWMECTGQAGLNGDLTNTATWAQVKATGSAVLGQVIKRSNNASYQICTTAGAMSASEPAFSDTAGVTTTDTTAVWTSLGVVGNFTGGQAPHARLQSAFATNWFASGNTIYVGHNHAESQATAILAACTSALMAKILCHNSAGSYPPTTLATGATVSVTGNVAININVIGSAYFYGLTFSSAMTSTLAAFVIAVSTQAQNWYYFDNCSFQYTGSSGSAWLALGVNSGPSTTITFDNTTVKFAAVGQQIIPLFCQFYWKNTGPILVSGSVVPTSLFVAAGGTNFGNLDTIILEALDLSQITSLIYTQNFSFGNILIKDCKLNAGTSIASFTNSGLPVQLVRSSA